MPPLLLHTSRCSSNHRTPQEAAWAFPSTYSHRHR
jgi:hypothetical protein